jgi:hypothetical protein
MRYELNKKIINIPDKDIETFIAKYNLSQDEAIQLWLEDNDYLENEVVTELVEKTKGQRHYEKSDKSRKASTRERKVDEEKKALLNLMIDAINSQYWVENVKNEAEFSFCVGENNYTVKLVKHRPKKE